MNIDELTIGEVKQLKRMACSLEKKPKEEQELGVHIAILQRGWVFVGRLFKRGSYFTLKNAACVRHWGTTKGLGELAGSGPLSGTKLDASPDTTFHELTIIALMKADESKWQGKL